MSRSFHFSLGPVQAFVAQARRTRDFWGGSFLLSWLAGVAMNTVRHNGGSILFPRVDDNLFAWLEGRGAGTSPAQGTIPNRFSAEVPDEFDPNAPALAVHKAWQALAELVWLRDLAAVNKPEETEVIWKRQVASFWDTTWCLTEGGVDDQAMQRRKALRSHYAGPEPGLKCSLMDGWQELSGSSNLRDAEAFYQDVCDHLGNAYDLRPNEPLCTTAFIKRRFPYCFDSLQVKLPGNWTARGWKVSTGHPSVSYLACAHWLAEALQHADETDLNAFTEAAHRLAQGYGEWHTALPCVEEAYTARGIKAKLGRLDGDLFFESNLLNRRQYDNQDLAAEVRKRLRPLERNGAPTPYYAVLNMDGDSLGKLLQEGGDPVKVTEALHTFSGKVQSLVNHHNGFLIYAGGDDVLAILPLADALCCATQLHEQYIEEFAGRNLRGTISAGIVYAHVKTPLRLVLKEVHHVLDAIAKDLCGRDGLAVRVMRDGGDGTFYAQPWEKALDGRETLVLQTIADALGQEDEAGEEKAGFSSKFFYRVREVMQALQPAPGVSPTLTDEEAVDFILAEHIRGLEASEGIKLKQDQINTRRLELTELLSQCRCHRRSSEGAVHATDRIQPEASVLVRFLAQKGGRA